MLEDQNPLGQVTMSQLRIASKDAAVLSNQSIQTLMIYNPFRLPWIGW
jgi:hypothetical protein